MGNIDKETEEIKEYLQQGEMLLGNGKYAEASIYADKVLKIDEMSFRAYIIKGAAFANDGEISDAKECFKRALLIDKKSGEAHYHMGSICLLEGNIETGIEEYQSALECGYDYPEVYFNMGLAHEEREEHELALHQYTRAIRKDSLNPLFYIRKAGVLTQENRYEEALAVYKELRKKCPDCFEGYHYAAQLYTMLGEYDQADEILRIAEAEFEADEDILLDRLKVLVTKGDIDAALQEVEKAEKLIENSIHKKSLLLNKAKLCGMQEDMKSCISLMEEALLEDESEELDTELHYLLIQAYQIEKNMEKVKEHAQKLDTYDNHNPYALGAKFFLAFSEQEADVKEKAYREAIRYYRNIALEDAGRVESYIYRTLCHKELGEFEKALETIDYVMLLHSTGKLWFIKGTILKEMGRVDEAKEAYRKAEEAGEDMSLWKESE